MASLGSYIFKPKHGPEITQKILEAFCNDFLRWEDEGFYIWWKTSNTTPETPEGYIEFNIESEHGNLECFTECCFSEEEIETPAMVNDFFVMLGDDFWYDNEEGGKDYNFYERELSEVIMSLSEADTRVACFGADRTAFVGYKDRKGSCGFHRVDMLDFLMSTPLRKNTTANQLTLPLA